MQLKSMYKAFPVCSPEPAVLSDGILTLWWLCLTWEVTSYASTFCYDGHNYQLQGGGGKHLQWPTGVKHWGKEVTLELLQFLLVSPAVWDQLHESQPFFKLRVHNASLVVSQQFWKSQQNEPVAPDLCVSIICGFTKHCVCCSKVINKQRGSL